MAELKQVILIRTDLKMSKGKIAAQAAHASVEAVLTSNKKLIKAWRDMGMKKIALKVNSETELIKYYELALKNNLNASLIKDAGRTEIPAGSKTCVAIGPDAEAKINKITGELKPF
jgi:PTH2 family peptidyl-tRNA hydrolase